MLFPLEKRVWLVPAGDGFFYSAKLSSNRAHGRGEGESVGRTQRVAVGKKIWEVRIKEIKLFSVQVI